MLGQAFLETPISRAGLRHPLKVSYNGGTTGEIGVAGSEHQNFVHQNKGQRFYVKLKYGKEVYKTPLTARAAAGDEYTWFVIHPTLPSLLLPNLRDRDYPKAWLIKTNEHDYGRLVPFEVFSLGIFQRDKVCANGSFSVSP